MPFVAPRSVLNQPFMQRYVQVSNDFCTWSFQGFPRNSPNGTKSCSKNDNRTPYLRVTVYTTYRSTFFSPFFLKTKSAARLAFIRRSSSWRRASVSLRYSLHLISSCRSSLGMFWWWDRVIEQAGTTSNANTKVSSILPSVADTFRTS